MENLSDVLLLERLVACVAQERVLVVEVLRYLREVEERSLHLHLGFPSLYAFCRGHLGYSEGESFARIQAMRLVRSVPKAEGKISGGKLSLTVAAKVQCCIKREKVADKEAFVEMFSGKSAREADAKIAELFPGRQKPEKAKPVDGEFTRIEFNASRELMADFGRLRELLAHRNFSGSYEALFGELAKIALDKLEPKRPRGRRAPRGEGKREAEVREAGAQTAETRAPKTQTPETVTQETEISAEEPRPEPANPAESRDDTLKREAPKVIRPKHSRYIPREVRYAVWERDQGRCQYRSPAGRPCHSAHGVEYDHIRPFAEGGAHTIENLRLLCSAHNQHRNVA